MNRNRSANRINRFDAVFRQLLAWYPTPRSEYPRGLQAGPILCIGHDTVEKPPFLVPVDHYENIRVLVEELRAGQPVLDTKSPM
jgi:hypothetical protein